jgi:hypothetical protein
MRTKRPNASAFALGREKEIILCQASESCTLASMLFDRAPYAGLPIGGRREVHNPTALDLLVELRKDGLST